MSYSQKWSLDPIFPGGSRSPQLAQFLHDVTLQIQELHRLLQDPTSIQKGILLWQDISERLGQAGSFVGCLIAQNVNDLDAEQLQGHLTELHASFNNASSKMDEHLKAMSDEAFRDLVQKEPFSAIAYPLTNRRQRIKDKLPIAQETLINDLAVDGYHAWAQLYGTVIGRILIPVHDRQLSWGQAYNLLSNPDRSIRQTVFRSSNEVWKANAHLFSPILNRVYGFRLKLYEKRGWPILKDTLDYNRMSRETLDTMWKVIDNNKRPFFDYMQTKARLLGINQLHWYDLEAPLNTSTDKPEPLLSYDEAAAFIIEQLSTVSPQMGHFAKRAFEQQWIEAEDRGGKRPGGFCTDLPLLKESRIFMTYSGTKESVFTLAHELGHAFHNHVIFDLPEMARQFPMNVAETASTFAELVVSEAALKQEKDPAKRLKLLDGKLQRSIIFLCNIQARFHFDVAFHEERKAGMLSNERLCELMESCQKQAYGNNLAEYHPYFWASKTHFSSSTVPFYNYPYTFGFLFSLGIYLRALEEKNFESRYIGLLADTGRLSTEDLAKKHLSVDLREEAFWQHALDFLKQDADEFQQLTRA